MSREILRVIQDDHGYAILVPDDREWARADDPRRLESYVSLLLRELGLLDELLGRRED